MSLQDRVSLLAPILISVIVQKTWYVAFMGNKKIKWKRGFDTYCAVLSPPRKSVSPIWRSDSNTNNNEVRLRMRGLQKLPFKGCVALCVKSAEVWFDKRSGVWYSEAERHREREKRERERALIEMACAWLKGASEGQSPCEATATRAIIPPRCIWISAMERSICLARGDTPPLADCRGCRVRARERETEERQKRERERQEGRERERAPGWF